MTTYREVLTDRRFRLLFTTRTLGIVGDTLRITTLSVLVYADTRSALFSALAFGVGFLPQLLGSMLLGSLTDSLRPRSLITAGYLLQAAGALLLGLLRLPVVLSLTVVGTVALVSPVFNGASSRLVAETLDGDAYVLGRSLNNIASSGAQLVGLAGGGIAVAALGPRGALLVAAAIQLAVAAAIRLRLPDLPALHPADGAVVRRSWSGNGTLLRTRPVRRLLLAQWLPSAFVASAESLVVAYAGAGASLPAATASCWPACRSACWPGTWCWAGSRPRAAGAAGRPAGGTDGPAAAALRPRRPGTRLRRGAAGRRLRLRLRARPAAGLPGGAPR
ncbi:hypothetical protein ACFQZC_06295 [Streptacidiphilus monticola]